MECKLSEEILNESYTMFKYYITIDPFMSIKEYSNVITALNNNNVKYNEFISTKPPYNWYINLNELPIMVNYDIGTPNDNRFLVSKVKPLRPNEFYKLKRRETDGTSQASLEKFIYNDAFKDVKNKYAICFRYKSNVELQELTRKLGIRVYKLGTYRGRQLAIGYNKYIKGEITPEYIVMEKLPKEMNNIGEFEMMINYKWLNSKDKIIKYTQTPYVENGKLNQTKVNI